MCKRYSQFNQKVESTVYIKGTTMPIFEKFGPTNWRQRGQWTTSHSTVADPPVWLPVPLTNFVLNTFLKNLLNSSENTQNIILFIWNERYIEFLTFGFNLKVIHLTLSAESSKRQILYQTLKISFKVKMLKKKQEITKSQTYFFLEYAFSYQSK